MNKKITLGFTILAGTFLSTNLMADNLCVEDNVLKCKELGYTESSCPNGGLACQYDTSLWYCAKWTCADGRLYSAENKVETRCTTCVETSYKNLNCYECKENTCSSTNCSVGDVFYSDGTCCPIENFDCLKSPIGVVYALSATKGGIPYTTSYAKKTKSNHGRVIALKNITANSNIVFDPENPYGNSSDTFYFGLYDTDVEGLTNYNSSELMLTAFQNSNEEIYNGKINTQKIVAASPKWNDCVKGTYTYGTNNYSRWCAPTAAKATVDYYPPEINKNDVNYGAGNWYLPSLGELALLFGLNVNQMTEGSGTTGATGSTKSIVNKTLSALVDKSIDSSTLTNGYYWSSVEYNKNQSWFFPMSYGSRGYHARSDKYSVRPSLEF